MYKLYSDTLIEIQAYTEQLEFAEETKMKLEKLLEIRKPHDMKAMAFDNVGRGCRDDTTDDRTYTRLYYTNARIKAYTEILDRLQKEKQRIEDELKMCEGLQYKIYYLNRVKGMSLWRVSEELGYSISHIEKVSAEISKNVI